jgi:hypothetical protein
MRRRRSSASRSTTRRTCARSSWPVAGSSVAPPSRRACT